MTDSKRILILTVVSKVLLFGLPDYHRAQFESLCADQIIRWRKHVSETARELGIGLVLVSEIGIVVVSCSPFSHLRAVDFSCEKTFVRTTQLKLDDL